MKHTTIILSLGLLAFVAGMPSAFAQESATAEVRVRERAGAEARAIATSTRAQMEAKRIELKDQIEARKVELKAETRAASEAKREELRSSASANRSKNADGQAGRIDKVAAESTRRLSDAVSKIEGARDRLASKLSEFEGRGVDVSRARASLASSTPLIAEAKSAIASIASIEIDEENVKDGASALREAILSAQAAVQRAHRAVMDAIPQMKGFEAEARASTKATTTTP